MHCSIYESFYNHLYTGVIKFKQLSMQFSSTMNLCKIYFVDSILSISPPRKIFIVESSKKTKERKKERKKIQRKRSETMRGMFEAVVSRFHDLGYRLESTTFLPFRYQPDPTSHFHT